MAAPLLAELLGGTPFLGFIAAVAFATILAVVAGLTLAGASALSHDIFVHVVRARTRHAMREQMRVARIGDRRRSASLAVLLGILFRGQNVAFMVGLAFAIACSANFPALLLSIVWRRFTHDGRGRGDRDRRGLSLLLIVLSPTVWVDLLGNPKAIFPLRNPAIVSMSAAFLVAIVGLARHARARGAKRSSTTRKLRTYLGVGRRITVYFAAC